MSNTPTDRCACIAPPGTITLASDHWIREGFYVGGSISSKSAPGDGTYTVVRIDGEQMVLDWSVEI